MQPTNTLNTAFSQLQALSSSSSERYRHGESQRDQGGRRNRHNQHPLFAILLQLIQLLIEQLQIQHRPRSQYQTQDGTNNNSRYPELGSADQLFRQFLPRDEHREIGGSTEARLPNAREVSNVVADQQGDTQNKKGLSDMFWLWGQFLDHDINLGLADENNPADIQVPTGDKYFDPNGTGAEVIGFNRSNTATDEFGHKGEPNAITAYIDGSNVYGSSDEVTDKLRSHTGGRLLEGVNGLLPTDDKGQFLAGDIRVNEHAGLSSMHTLWMREHNRVADNISNNHPRWSDERVFQESRKQVIAQMQAITYNEFIPKLLGKDKIGSYEGYNSRLSPQISNSFTTAAFRLGHTMLSPTIQRLDEQGNEIKEGHLSLRDAFFRPDKVVEAGIDPILRGFASQTAQAVDPLIIDDVRNFLFGKPGDGGFDLAALNTQRGRDHGLSSLNDSREALGLKRIESFDDPAWEGDFGNKLSMVYESVDDVDLWVGGLAEKKDGDSLVGVTFTEILSDQFKRLRSADSFWYEKQFSRRQVKQFDQTTLADVIKRNTGIQSIQDNVLVAMPRGNVAAPAIRLAQGANGALGALAEQIPAQPIDREQQQRIREAIERGFLG